MRTAVVFVFVLLACCNRSASTAAPAASSAPAVASSPSPVPVPSASATASVVTSGDSSGRTVSTFDKDTAGSAPTGFTSARTGQGREGKWIVRAESDAPSAPNVVAQTDVDPTDGRFALLVAEMTPIADVNASVKCKPVSGKVDQACGLVVRYYDPDNYYLASANALENNVRFYVVKDGKRQQLASWSGKVTSNEWHALHVIAHGSTFVVQWDHVKVIEQTEKTFPNGGKVGLWTKADSVTYFDELVHGPLTNL